MTNGKFVKKERQTERKKNKDRKKEGQTERKKDRQKERTDEYTILKKEDRVRH